MNLGINSVSRMNQEQINQFPVCTSWAMNRPLWEFQNSREPFGNRSYEDEMGKAGKLLLKTVENLNEKDIYFDVGAGEGKAIAAYRRIFPNRAKVVGVSVTRSDEYSMKELIEREKKDDKFCYYLCDFLDFPANSLAGRVSVITDIYGATNYSGNPTRVIQQMGKLLKEGGLAFIKFESESGIISPSENIVPKYDGVSKQLLQYWFHTIRGFDVIQDGMNLEESKKRHVEILKDIPSVDLTNNGSKIVLRRNSDPVEVDTLVPTMERNQDLDLSKQGIRTYTWELSEHSKSMLSKDEHKKPVRVA